MKKGGYSKEIAALKVTTRWLLAWAWFWVFEKVTSVKSPVHPAYLAALYVVLRPVADLAVAPVHRWLEKCWVNFCQRSKA